MRPQLAYHIDRLEVRLKGAKAARDWDEVHNIYMELQELYTLQKAYKELAN